MSSALTNVRQRYPKLVITPAATTDLRGPEEGWQGRLDMVALSRFGVVLVPTEPGLRERVLGRDARSRSAGAAVPGLCAAAGFRSSMAATVDDVATVLGLVAVGWGITIVPELTPLTPGRGVRRIRIEGVDACRYGVLLIRDGEQDSPELAPVVSAVHKVVANFGYL
ncbi:MAG: putative LysR-family transcriptional regulator [Marmoricola sp.]|nr:putative LysR-family transcriptional regulator [Marmoricola sp.]